ncbi:hypothetical protein B0O99DRAFT_737353 [Bisporella sp. PMI_857]|nr:hypothetical protein B0O99DRAFT_737706 [Bisporella sp. PMI_857]KAH8600595.1 hypothetical protein B0O99DRAFT_737353 [Bisporella sp. PMI_857]
MLKNHFSVLLLTATGLTTGCIIPAIGLPNNITTGFAIQVQNASFHLYLSLAGDSVKDLTLVNGVITRLPVRAVINGEYTVEDNTTKLSMTERSDPRAIFDVIYGCNPDNDQLQLQVNFKARDTLPGGHICVRTASGGRYEFRYSPPGNTVVAPIDRPCIKVTLAVVSAV